MKRILLKSIVFDYRLFRWKVSPVISSSMALSSLFLSLSPFLAVCVTQSSRRAYQWSVSLEVAKIEVHFPSLKSYHTWQVQVTVSPQNCHHKFYWVESRERRRSPSKRQLEKWGDSDSFTLLHPLLHLSLSHFLMSFVQGGTKKNDSRCKASDESVKFSLGLVNRTLASVTRKRSNVNKKSSATASIHLAKPRWRA